MNITNKINKIWFRIKADYFRKSFYNDYCKLLTLALEKNYRITSLRDVYLLLHYSHKVKESKVLALRHDVDNNNVSANRSFFEIEKKYGARSTFYFRLSTVFAHRQLIRELLEQGFEVGYHFEEGATIAKRKKFRSREVVFKHQAEVQEMFMQNCEYFRRHVNPNLTSVCAHGDWLNICLGFTNNELIDKKTLNKVNLEFEAYEPSVVSMFDCYVSDVAPYPERWKENYSLDHAISDEKLKIHLLTHERRWFPGVIPNFLYSIQRAIDEIVYRFF